MRYSDKIRYYVYSNDWTGHAEYYFMASMVPSERDIIDGVLPHTLLDENELYVERLGTNAVKPDFHVFRLGYSNVIFYIRSEKNT